MGFRVDAVLCKALLARAVVSSPALEDAVQQQLVHGGALDSLLLELGLVDEPTLRDVLASAWLTPAVEPAQFEAPDANAARALPRRLAVTLGMCPVSVDDDGGVHVLCASPLDRELLAEVSTLLQRTLHPHVVPEVRVWQALQRAYDVVADERIAALLAGLGRILPPRPVPAAPSPRAAVDSGASSTWELVDALAHLAAQDSREGITHVATAYARRFLPFAAVIGVRGATCIGWHREGASEGRHFDARPFEIPDDCMLGAALASHAPSLRVPDNTAGNAALFGWLGRRRPRTVLIVPLLVSRRLVGALVADSGIRARDHRELSDLVAFSARLGPALETLLRKRRGAQLDTTTTPPAPSAAPPDPSPLPPSMPSAASTSSTSSTSSVPSTMPGDSMAHETQLSTQPIARPSGTVRPGRSVDGSSPFARAYVPPQRAVPLALPILVDDGARTITVESIGLSAAGALLGSSRVAASPAAESSSTSPAAASRMFAAADDNPDIWRGALHTTVEQGLQGGSARASERILDDDAPLPITVVDPGWLPDVEPAPHAALPPRRTLSFSALSTSTLAEIVDAHGTPEVDDTEGPDRLGLRDDVDDAEQLTADPDEIADARGDEDPRSVVLPARAAAHSLTVLPVAALFEQLHVDDPAVIARAQRELVQRGAAAVSMLADKFPGRLLADPFDSGMHVQRAHELGPLVEVAYLLGRAGLDAALAHVDSRHPAHRFAAVLLFALTPDPRAVDVLRARLHDHEPRIRALAVEALLPFVHHARFEALRVHLRERLRSPVLEARRRAAELVGIFVDEGAVAPLLGLLERAPERISEGGAELVVVVQRALRAITLQDFGARAKNWEKWWSRARTKPRVAWLVDALESTEQELRAQALSELMVLAGDDFGFRADADKRSRARAVQAWQQWWSDEQKRAPRPSAASLA